MTRQIHVKHNQPSVVLHCLWYVMPRTLGSTALSQYHEAVLHSGLNQLLLFPYNKRNREVSVCLLRLPHRLSSLHPFTSPHSAWGAYHSLPIYLLFLLSSYLFPPTLSPSLFSRHSLWLTHSCETAVINPSNTHSDKPTCTDSFSCPTPASYHCCSRRDQQTGI